MKENIEKAIEDLAKMALRTLILAYRVVDTKKNEADEVDDKGVHKIEKENLILLCVVGIKDILRKQVEKAVKDCITAGFN